MCEGIRQRLRSLPCFDLYSAFVTCDLYNDGVISKEELRRLIDCRGFYVTDTDAQQLVNKMDKDRDGVVSYSEVRILNKSNFISEYSSEENLSPRATVSTDELIEYLKMNNEGRVREISCICE